jgi:hypothetical protein
VSKLSTRAIMIALLAIAPVGTVRAQSDPRIGTWTLNIAQSKYTPGPPPAKEIRTYAAAGLTLSVSVESVDQQGNHVSLHYAASENGKDYPLTGLASADAIAMKRIDAQTFESYTKKNGKIIGTTRGKISKDGKILILAVQSVSPTGQAISNIAVFDKK